MSAGRGGDGVDWWLDWGVIEGVVGLSTDTVDRGGGRAAQDYTVVVVAEMEALPHPPSLPITPNFGAAGLGRSTTTPPRGGEGSGGGGGLVEAADHTAVDV